MNLKSDTNPNVVPFSKVIENNLPAVDYSKLRLNELAVIIGKDWKIQGKGIYFGAKPYLEAMACLDNINQKFIEDSGKSIVAYFLSNAATWKGEVAKAVKKELNKRLKG